MAIQCTQIGGGYTDILTVPAGKSWAVTTMLFCNTALPQDIYTDAGDTYLDLHLCKSGVAAGDGNQVLNNIPIPAGETFSFDTEKIILEAGDIVKAATTSPTSITATVSYIEV
jgi:hypothetical protein